MHKRLIKFRTTSMAVGLLALLVTSGCETTANWLKGRRTAEPEEVILNAPDANQYLYELQNLATGDPLVQAEIVADSEAAATLTPSPSTRLRYALVRATPGHAGTNYGEARHVLQQLLAQTEMMTSAEVALANIYLAAADSQNTMQSEYSRLATTTSQAATTEEAASSRRISGLESENRRLRESLADAEAKIEALSAIERSIREQTESGDPQ